MTPVGPIFTGGGGGGGVTDHGALTGLGDDDHTQYLLADGSRSVSGLLDCNAGLDVDGGLTDIGTGSYSLADGEDDLGVAGDLEVDDDLQLDGTKGIGTAPSSGRLIYGIASGSVVIIGADVQITSTYSTSLAGGLSVLNFEFYEQFTGAAQLNVARAANMQVAYDRGGTGGSNHRCVEARYGVEAGLGSPLSGGTHTWRAIYIDPKDAGVGDVTGGTIEMIDIETTAAPSNYGSATFTHKAAKFGDAVQIVTGDLDIDSGDFIISSGDISVTGDGTNAPTYVSDESITYDRSSGLTDAYAASMRLTPTYNQSGFGFANVDRHNYIDLNDVSLGAGASVDDACIFRFDANPGTHAAIDSGTTKSSPGVVDAWAKININGNVYYCPCYTGTA